MSVAKTHFTKRESTDMVENQWEAPQILSQAVRQLLHMPATSTSSERVILMAGLTVTKLRSCLKPLPD